MIITALRQHPAIVKQDGKLQIEVGYKSVQLSGYRSRTQFYTHDVIKRCH